MSPCETSRAITPTIWKDMNIRDVTDPRVTKRMARPALSKPPGSVHPNVTVGIPAKVPILYIRKVFQDPIGLPFSGETEKYAV
ncbi:hypothetical protein PM082_004851 [Marasmius tenuissimus]|nr:hypothetical protein PM082_004851 [Marasmius tenuissimus]